MKLFKLIVIFVFSLLFYVACSSNAAPTITTESPVAVANVGSDASANTASSANQEVAAAKTLYDQKCVKCHQQNGEGGKNIQIGDVTIDHVPSFKNERVAAASDEQYVKKILNGGDGMPKFKDKLSKEQIDSLVSYIRSEFQGK